MKKIIDETTTSYVRNIDGEPQIVINGALIDNINNVASSGEISFTTSDGSVKEARVLKFFNKKKLGHGIAMLPHGIIDKKITGIGGTTVELQAKRNSIIVEPLKAIASSKAAQNSHFLYVGSPISIYKKTTSIEDIKKYHQDDEIEFKKIIVVADSLPKVIQALGEDIFDQYFLVLDEIDSFQCDSTYRDSMETCLDYYKKFEPTSRCMITATMLEFSDPDLKEEALTILDYKNPETRDIKIVKTNTIRAVVATLILEKVKVNEKVVIAYNSIDSVFDIIDILTKKFNIDKSEIRIMCSRSNRKKAGDFFGEISAETLPAKIVFLTSAYFTGVDINESYHSIAISNSNLPFTLLSDHKLKQIAGRCRNGLLSETIIYNTQYTEEEVWYKISDLVKLGKQYIAKMQCFDSQYNDDQLLKAKLESIQTILYQHSDFKGYRLVRKNINNERVISFFNIDAFLEAQRIENEIYSKAEQLPSLLKSQGNNVDFKYLNLSWEKDFFDESEKLSDQRKSELIQEAIDELQKVDINTPQAIDDLIIDCGSAFQMKIFTQFKQLYKIIEKDVLIDKITEFSLVRDSRKFDNYKMAAIFYGLDNTDPFKIAVLSKFPIGRIITNIEVQKELNAICTQTGIIHNPYQTPTSAWKDFTSFFETKWKRKIGEKGPKKYEILRLNPDNIQLIGQTKINTLYEND